MKISVDASGVSALLHKAPNVFRKEIGVALKEAATLVQVDARQKPQHRYTSRFGKLAQSVITKIYPTFATVELNTGVARYAPYIHEGWKRPKNKSGWSWAPDKFLPAALEKNRDKITRLINGAVARAIGKAGLK